LQYDLFEKTVEATLQAPVFVTQYPAEVSPLAAHAERRRHRRRSLR
jgi:lysyl-tRNA synthetase class II